MTTRAVISNAVRLALTTSLLLSAGMSAAEVQLIGADELQRRLNICLASEPWLQRACLEALRTLNTGSNAEPKPEAGADTASPSYEEMHMVGIYEPQENKTSKGNILRGEVEVRIDRPGKSLALVLASYEAARWIVNTSPDTKVSRIVIGGHGANRSEIVLNGEPASAEIGNLPVAYQSEGDSFQPFHQAAIKLTRVDRADSFHGSYTAPIDGFTISAAPGVPTEAEVGNDLHNNARDPDTLPAQMRAILKGNARSTVNNWKFTQTSILGIDFKGTAVQFDIPVALPEVSWPMGVAYDPEHGRIWGVTLGGEGYLYEYDIRQDQWLAWSMNNFDAGGLIYDATTNRLVATPGPFRNSDYLVMDRQAKVISRVRIKHSDYPGLINTYDPGNEANPAMVPLAVEGDLLLVQASQGFRGAASPKPSLKYLVNLGTGTVELIR